EAAAKIKGKVTTSHMDWAFLLPRNELKRYSSNTIVFRAKMIRKASRTRMKLNPTIRSEKCLALIGYSLRNLNRMKRQSRKESLSTLSPGLPAERDVMAPEKIKNTKRRSSIVKVESDFLGRNAS